MSEYFLMSVSTYRLYLVMIYREQGLARRHAEALADLDVLVMGELS